MTMPRYAARRDANEPQLVTFARALGWWLTKLDEPCDWLGCRRGVWYPIEVKTEDGELTAKQQIFHREAFKRGARVLIWKSTDDVLRDSNARQSA